MAQVLDFSVSGRYYVVGNLVFPRHPQWDAVVVYGPIDDINIAFLIVGWTRIPQWLTGLRIIYV